VLYDKPVRELLAECVQQLSEPFTRAEIFAWFRTHYPSVQPGTLSTQLAALTVGANPASVPGLAGCRPLVRRVARGLYVRAESSTLVDAPSARVAGNVTSLDSAVADVILVGCVKSKVARAMPARDLYTSTLFARRRSYAEASGRPWYILSSRWGLVTPDEVIAPYEMYLAEQSATYRRAWGAFVAAQLQLSLGSLSGRVVEVHAGDTYVAAVRAPLESDGATVVDPVDARSMGETLAWYGDRIPEPPRAVPSLVEQALARLLERDEAIPSRDLERFSSTQLGSRGLYAWWVDDEGSRHLALGLGLPVHAGLIYAGQAGATRWPSGRASSNTLKTRLLDMHLGGRAEFSTFRRTLAACLQEPLGLAHEDDERLSRWMRDHLAVTVWPTADGGQLGAIEDQVLSALDPPLNLRGMPETPVRTRLRDLRRRRS
jgi:hypothetical protein